MQILQPEHEIQDIQLVLKVLRIEEILTIRYGGAAVEHLMFKSIYIVCFINLKDYID